MQNSSFFWSGCFQTVNFNTGTKDWKRPAPPLNWQCLLTLSLKLSAHLLVLPQALCYSEEARSHRHFYHVSHGRGVSLGTLDLHLVIPGIRNWTATGSQGDWILETSHTKRVCQSLRGLCVTSDAMPKHPPWPGLKLKASLWRSWRSWRLIRQDKRTRRKTSLRVRCVCVNGAESISI